MTGNDEQTDGRPDAVGLRPTGSHRAIGVIVGYLVGSYLLDFASVWLPSLENIHPFTLFYYCVPNAVLKAGELPWPHLAMLFIIGAGSATAGWLYWRVRDIYAA